MKTDREWDQHPSYGVITWSRQQHGTQSAQLFQSEMNHHEVISLRIHTAKLGRSLHNDYVHSDKNIVEVLLSPAQFTQFFTSPNIGSGTPCTLSWTQQDGRIEQVYKPSRYKKYGEEIGEDLIEIKEQMDTLLAEFEEALNEKTVKKATLKGLAGQLSMLRQNLFSNIPFLKTQMHEHMDKVVEQGKVEIESYLDSVIRKHGLERLRENAPELQNLSRKRLRKPKNG